MRSYQVMGTIRQYGCLALIWGMLLLPATVWAQAPARIVSLAPSVTEVLYDLGLGDHVIAVSAYCNYPPEAKRKPVVGGMTNPSLEVIAAMKPDLVVLTDDGNPQQAEERLKKFGIRTYVFRARKLNDLPNEIRLLGNALQIAGPAGRRAERIEKSILRYKRTPPSGVRQKALFIVQPEPLMVAGPNTAIDDVSNLLGLRNIAGDSPLAYPRFSLEEVVRQDPDFIFVAKGHGIVAADTQRLLKRLGQLKAVRKGRVYYIGDSLLRLGPRITEGIAEMAGYLRN
jgi:iron complex transport system substrate-binding protein